MLKILLTAVILISAIGFLKAENRIEKDEIKRPKVGLVMSGGGAKGFAYIGLLKVLEEVDMPIDYIGGASMGAIIAAMYAVGYSPDKMAEIIREQNWNSFISDFQERKYISFEEKQYSEKYVFSLPIEGKGISLSKSLNTSFNIDLMLNRLLAPAAHITDFSELPIPFLCIGTDLLTGEAVVLTKGNLARAVRGSMAIPGYFSPTEYDGRHLIDGGVVNNYPGEQVKAMGADILIGGDVQTGLKKSMDDIGSVTAILDQIISFNRVEANVKGVDLTDVHVKIGMPYGMMDFDKYDSIITIGENVAREHYEILKALADSLNEIEGVVPERKHIEPIEHIQLNEIVWAESELKVKEKYEKHFNELGKGRIAISAIEDKMLHLNGTGIYNELRYDWIPRKDSTFDVKIEAGNINKGSIAAGLQYNNTYGGSILLNLTLRNLNNGRGKLFTDVVLGQNPRLKSLFVINNGLRPGFGFSADMFALKFTEYEEGDKVNKWRFDNFNFTAFMPINLKNNVLFRAGFQYEVFRFKQEVVVDSTLEAFDKFTDYGNMFVSFEHDSRNKVNYTTAGSLLNVQLKHVFPFSDKWNNFISNATILSMRCNWFVKIGDRLVYKPELFGGYTFTEKLDPYTADIEPSGIYKRVPAVQHLFGFGGTNEQHYMPGHVSFTGFHYLEKMGLYAAKIGTNFEYNVYRKFYASILADIGYMENDITDFDAMEFLVGYGAKLSYDSFVGPIDMTISSSNRDTSVNVFFSLGYLF